MKRFIYADNAETTKVSEEVFEAMRPYFCEQYGNPSSLYAFGQKSREAVENARAQVAKAINAQPDEIFFTSCGSEADNWAIKGIAELMAAKGKQHLITTKFEHHAVLHVMQRLEKSGFEVTYLDVHSDGLVRADEVRAAIRPDTALVSVMYANNEIGTIQPIAEIGAVCRKAGVYFHTDAVQAIGHVHIDVKAQNIDMLAMSGHKFHAPKGVGALYIRKGIRFKNLIDGGAQESNRRAGTENVASIVGLGRAIEIAVSDIDGKAERVARLRDRLIDSALKIERSRLNGDRKKRLPGNINMCFEGVEGESLLLWMDLNGICCSSGSACTSGSLDPSHVLLAIGLPHEIAHGSLRLSLGEDITEEEVDYIAGKLPEIITYLRNMSPFWERIKKEENNKK